MIWTPQHRAYREEDDTKRHRASPASTEVSARFSPGAKHNASPQNPKTGSPPAAAAAPGSGEEHPHCTMRRRRKAPSPWILGLPPPPPPFPSSYMAGERVAVARPTAKKKGPKKLRSELTPVELAKHHELAKRRA